jgi:hypothetical protein
MAHFYLRALHVRLRHGDAAAILQPQGWLDTKQAYLENVCRCRQCQELLDSADSAARAFDAYGDSTITVSRRRDRIVRLNYPTPEAKQLAARHYLYNKAREFEDLQEKSLRELLDDLDRAGTAFEPTLGAELAGHLQVWAGALRGAIT